MTNIKFINLYNFITVSIQNVALQTFLIPYISYIMSKFHKTNSSDLRLGLDLDKIIDCRFITKFEVLFDFPILNALRL